MLNNYITYSKKMYLLKKEHNLLHFGKLIGTLDRVKVNEES